MALVDAICEANGPCTEFDDCPVCLGAVDNPCAFKPCGHQLCKQCAFPSLVACGMRCPMCRVVVAATEPMLTHDDVVIPVGHGGVETEAETRASIYNLLCVPMSDLCHTFGYPGFMSQSMRASRSKTTQMVA